MAGFVIRKHSNELLFQADRSKTSRFFWTYKLSLVMVWTSQEAAEAFVKQNLKHGSFSVITYDQAHTLRIRKDEQHQRKVDFAESNHRWLYDDDQGWDAHKS